MLLATKVWEDGKPVPVGLFDRSECPSAPDTWFAEDPEYAAVLFAMEVHMVGCRPDGVVAVHVVDTEGHRHLFKVRVGHALDAHVIEAARNP